MTYIEEQILVDRDRTSDEIYAEIFSEGKADAAFGELPQSNNPAYLDGYIAHYQADFRSNGERNPNFSTRTYSNINQQFAFGWCDGDGEF